MPMQRETYIPQAMQRHAGCAWVRPVRAEDAGKPKGEVAVADDVRAAEPQEEMEPVDPMGGRRSGGRLSLQPPTDLRINDECQSH